MSTLVAIALVVLVIGGVIWIVRRTSPPAPQFSSAAYMEDFRRRFPPTDDARHIELRKAAKLIAFTPSPAYKRGDRVVDRTTNPYAVNYPNRDIPEVTSPLSVYSPLNPASPFSVISDPTPAPAVVHDSGCSSGGSDYSSSPCSDGSDY